jgi:hypothetical protein
MTTGHHHHAGDGPVVVDVGGNVGALVLLAEPRMVGAEIEISPVGRPSQRQHVAVHPRQTGGRVIHAAVYPALVAGGYDLWDPEGSPALTVQISGGRITQAVWPGA